MILIRFHLDAFIVVSLQKSSRIFEYFSLANIFFCHFIFIYDLDKKYEILEIFGLYVNSFTIAKMQYKYERIGNSNKFTNESILHFAIIDSIQRYPQVNLEHVAIRSVAERLSTLITQD